MIKQSDFTDEEKKTISKFLLGGAALGGSAALVTSLLNYLNKVKKEVPSSDADDDTLYVYKKQASVANGLAIAGGTTTALLSYLAITKLYQKFRNMEAQKALDEAQHIFLDEAGYKEASFDKSAEERTGMGVWDALAGAPIALPLLLALAGGATVNSLLKSQFAEKKPKIKAPRRIEVLDEKDVEALRQAGGPTAPASPETEKYASAEVDSDAQEFLCRLALLNPVENSGLQALQKAAALGGHEMFKHTAMQIGFIPAMATVKGAFNKQADAVREHIALGWMNKCAYLKPSIGLLAAGEFVETYPSFCRQAAHMEPYQQEALLKVASILGQAIRSEMSEELGLVSENTIEFAKEASAANTEDVLSRLLTKLNEKEADGEASDGTLLGANPVTSGDENESTNTSGEEAGIKDEDSPSRPDEAQKQNFINNTKSLRAYSGELPDDIIDKMLSPGK